MCLKETNIILFGRFAFQRGTLTEEQNAAHGTECNRVVVNSQKVPVPAFLQARVS